MLRPLQPPRAGLGSAQGSGVDLKDKAQCCWPGPHRASSAPFSSAGESRVGASSPEDTLDLGPFFSKEMLSAWGSSAPGGRGARLGVGARFRYKGERESAAEVGSALELRGRGFSCKISACQQGRGRLLDACWSCSGLFRIRASKRSIGVLTHAPFNSMLSRPAASILGLVVHVSLSRGGVLLGSTPRACRSRLQLGAPSAVGSRRPVVVSGNEVG